MSELIKNYKELIDELGAITLVAVSKTKPAAVIKELYNLGHRDFGENYVQELLDKRPSLPPDIRWHYIGHLQSNKVKYIASYIHLIHGVDSLKLLQEINKQAQKHDRIIDCLLQVHIANEETKFGLDGQELETLTAALQALQLPHIRVKGLMGMASFTDDPEKIRTEFRRLKDLFDRYAAVSIPNCNFSILSMGMSADYKIAVEEGSNLVRIGSLLFGERVTG